MEQQDLEKDSAVVRLLGYFVPGNLREDNDDLFRARVLVALLLTYVTILLLGGILFVLFIPLSSQYKVITSIIVFTPAILLFALLNYYRFSGSHKFCAHTALFMSFLLVFTGVFISGGPFISPANYVLPIPALMAFCILGTRAGFFWTLAVFAMQCVFFLASFGGFQFPYMVDGNVSNINESIDWTIAFFGIIAIAVIYENMNMRLKAERDREHAQVRHLANHDSLTGLPNRTLFNQRLQQAIYRSKHQGVGFALFYIDLDSFKPINDAFGHQSGDIVLKEMADRIQLLFRHADTVARLGGDEFAIILEDLKEPSLADGVVSKLRAAIRDTIQVHAGEVSVEASIGVAICPRDGKDAETLVHHADKEMYRVKAEQKLQVHTLAH